VIYSLVIEFCISGPSTGNSNYHAAHTCAMPDPIKPPPIIVTRWIADLHDVVDIDLTWKLAQVFSIVKQQLYYFLLQCTTKLKLQLKPEVKGHKSSARLNEVVITVISYTYMHKMCI